MRNNKFYTYVKSLACSCRVSEDWIISARRKYANRSLLRKKSNSISLRPEQVAQIKEMWRAFDKNALKLFCMDQYAVYNKYCDDEKQLAYYIPDDFYYCYADTFFSNYHSAICLDNKNLYDLYFPDIRRPKCIVRKMGGGNS